MNNGRKKGLAGFVNNAPVKTSKIYIYLYFKLRNNYNRESERESRMVSRDRQKGQHIINNCHLKDFEKSNTIKINYYKIFTC